jgi:hypothetical protein
MLVEYGKDLITEFLIEPRSLKTKGREGQLLTSPSSRFLLCGL